MREWRKLMEDRGTRMDKPMKPQVVAWELGKRLSPTAIVSADSGTVATWFARQIPARRGQMHRSPARSPRWPTACRAAIAAQLAYPDRQVCLPATAGSRC